MTNYQELENQIQELQKEVERLKQEEKAEQIDLSTCIAGQLVQLRNGQFDYYEFKSGVDCYVIGGLTYEKDGRQYEYSQKSEYDVVKVFPAEIPVPDSFNAFYAKKVLEGRIPYYLNYTFTFTETPQGEQYWRDIFTGKTQLSLGDMIFIQKWVIQTL